MKSPTKLIFAALAAGAVFGPLNVSALALGSATGAVLLGKPLALSIGLQMDADEAASSMCFGAEVFYGERQQDPAKITVVPLLDTNGLATRLNVASITSVDEPVVTVYIRSGCTAKTTRKYVFLSELVGDLQPQMAERAVSNFIRMPAMPSPGAPAMDRPHALVGNEAPAQTRARVSAPSRPRVAVPAKNSADADVVRRSKAFVGSQATSKPRLKLSMMELTDINDPSLRLTPELLALPSDDLAKRELAAAAWRLLNTTEQDMVSADASQNALRNDLQNLKEITAKNLQDQQALSNRLLKAESARFSNPLVIGLGLLAVAALISLGMVWRRVRQQDSGQAPWWGGAVSLNDGHINSSDVDSRVNEALETLPPNAEAAASISTQAVVAPKPAFEVTPQALDIDLGLDAHPATQKNSLVQLSAAKPEPKSAFIRKSVQAVGGRRDFSQSLNATLHAINTTEMLDVRQQADFFMTLGQHDEAIRVLEENINLSGSSNPLVFLDLLKVLHTLSKKREFDRYRTEFNTIFTGRVPDFLSFHRPGRNLEDYPEICNEITKLWATEEVIEYIEDCLIRTEEDEAEDYFELNAYRDLLTLHALASRVMAQSTSESNFVPFSATRPDRVANAEINISDAPVTSDSEATLRLIVNGKGDSDSGHVAGVDLDLSNSDVNLMHYDITDLQVTPKN